MNNFIYYSPTKFFFGKGMVDKIGEQVAAFGAKRALLVYGQGSVVRCGTLGRVVDSLTAAGVELCHLNGVRPNPEVQSVRAGIEVAREFQPDIIIPIGGGSVIDCAKAIGFGTLYDGDVWDFFCGKASPQKCIPLAAVLTIPAAGSEASSSCVISNDELGAKRGTNGDCFRPAMSFMDPELTFTLPPYQTAAGVTDMIAHICERWFSGVGDVRITDQIAAGLIKTLLVSGPTAINDPANYDARADIMWAGMLAHNDLAGCGRGLNPAGRAGGWESHGLEHEMSALKTDITHGAGLAVIMPAWMRFVWPADPSRFYAFGRLVFDMDMDAFADEATAVDAVIDRLQEFFASLGMPTKMGELGLTPEDVPALIERLRATKGEIYGAFKKLTMEDSAAIYNSAF